MVIKGIVIGYQVFQSGAAQLFVSTPANSTEKVFERGQIVRSLWQGKGTYSVSSVPDLLGASVVAFIGKNESGIIDLRLKGGETSE